MRKFATAGLLLTAGSILLSILITNDSSVVSEETVETPSSAFSSERMRMEWQMLHDPATGQIPYGIRGREIAFASTLPRRDWGVNLAKQSGAVDPVWRNRGPWRMGGRTRAIAFDVTGQDTILAGSVSSGIWRSSDRGESWTQTTTPEQSLGATTLVQDRRPGKNHIWYAGTGEGRGNSASSILNAHFAGDGVYKSTDNGRSWVHLPGSGSGTPGTRDVADVVWRLAMDRSNLEHDELYAAVDGAVRRSTDGGTSWNLVLGDTLTARNPSYAEVAVSSTGVVYAAIASDQQQGGLYRSVDGITYTRITPTLFPATYNRTVIEISPSDENRLYLLSETPRGGKGTGFDSAFDAYFHSLWTYNYLSGDGTGVGGTWEDRSENIPDYRPGLGGYNSQSSYNMVVRVKPDDENVVFLGGTNLYRSTDGFRSTDRTSWVGGYSTIDFSFSSLTNPLSFSYNYPGHHPDLHDVLFSPADPDLMLTASDGGVHATVDPMADSIEWISLNSGYLTSQFYSVAINQDPLSPEVLVGGLQDNGTWRSMGGGERDSWSEVSDSDGGFTAVSSDGRRYYTSKQLGILYAIELNDEGEQIGFRRIDPFGARNLLFISPFAVDPNDPATVYYPYSSSLYRHRDIREIPEGNINGATDGWELFRVGLVTGSSSRNTITAIACSDRNPSHRLWLGTTYSRLFRIDDGMGSDTTVVEVSSQSFPDSGWVNCVAVDPDDGDHAVVVFSNYGVRSLFATTDAGESWTDVSGNLEENRDGSGDGPSTRWMKILHRPGGTVYLLGTSTGLFSTRRLEAENTVWIREGAESIGYNVVTQVDARPADGLVAVATHGMGIFSATYQLSGLEDEATSRDRSAIESIVPHPVRQNATITYDLAPGRSGPVTLELYDLAGRSIMNMDLGSQHPGRKRTTFRADQLTSGTYILCLKLNQKRLTSSSVLVEN